MTLREDMLEKLQPTRTEEAEMAARVDALIEACAAALKKDGLPGTPTVQGSVAKGTWIRSGADLDCFILMPPEAPEELLKSAAEAVGKRVLLNPRKKYAQHPYVMGTFRDAQVDLVPAYAVAEATSKMSAVDRTPFHTAWVKTNLSPEARGDVRLLKQWCKGVDIYGAETSKGGFSGYLLEVLIHRLDGFAGVLDWFIGGCEPRRIAGGGDEVQDDVSPIIVVDPVDPARNCAAAVSEAVMHRAQEAAKAFAVRETPEFFHPPQPKSESRDVMDAAMAKQNAIWLSIVTTPETDRLDIVFPQFQKAARTITAELERAGFPVRRHRVDAWDEDASVGMQWMVQDVELASEKIHTGPPADKEPNAAGFRRKWDAHPDAVDGIHEVNGRLQVRVKVPYTRPAEWLQANLASMAFGKHVAAALGASPRIEIEPARADPAWGPTVADFVLDRRPWQRPVA